MKSIGSIKSLKNLKTIEIVFVVLLILYCLSGVSTPYNLAGYVDNIFFYASLFIIAYLLYNKSGPLLAIIFVIAAVVFVNRSHKVSPVTMAESQANKDDKMAKMNHFLGERSLEEDIVGQIVRTPDNIPNPASYHAVLCDNYNATEV